MLFQILVHSVQKPVVEFLFVKAKVWYLCAPLLLIHQVRLDVHSDKRKKIFDLFISSEVDHRFISVHHHFCHGKCFYYSTKVNDRTCYLFICCIVFWWFVIFSHQSLLFRRCISYGDWARTLIVKDQIYWIIKNGTEKLHSQLFHIGRAWALLFNGICIMEYPSLQLSSNVSSYASHESSRVSVCISSVALLHCSRGNVCLVLLSTPACLSMSWWRPVTK